MRIMHNLVFGNLQLLKSLRHFIPTSCTSNIQCFAFTSQKGRKTLEGHGTAIRLPQHRLSHTVPQAVLGEVYAEHNNVALPVKYTSMQLHKNLQSQLRTCRLPLMWRPAQSSGQVAQGPSRTSIIFTWPCACMCCTIAWRKPSTNKLAQQQTGSTLLLWTWQSQCPRVWRHSKEYLKL